MLTPELPKRPAGGVAKAAGSNQRFTERWPGSTFPLAMRSGNPLVVFVFEGSEPEKLGEKYWPLWKILIHIIRHPPSTIDRRGSVGQIAASSTERHFQCRIQH